MRRHDVLVGLIRSTVVVCAIGFAWSSFAVAEETTSPPAPSTTVQEETATPAESGDVQERAVQKQKTPPPSLAQPAPTTGTDGTSSVVGVVLEPDYRYPWEVGMTGSSCNGVLIDPQWVLTAAHCVTPNIVFGEIYYRRTDPYTGTVHTETRVPAPVGSRRDGVFIHPMYINNSTKGVYNDIALIKLAQPFTINSYIQTVAVPRSPRQPGVVGTVDRGSETGGQVHIFRAPIPVAIIPETFSVPASATALLLCVGDSGSGFVTVENGRATVRGIASQGTDRVCGTPSGGVSEFADVFTYHDWILQTIHKTDDHLAGSTRVRWSGRAARGVMSLNCINVFTDAPTTLQGPLNVIGVEEGVLCKDGKTETVECTLENTPGLVSPMLVPRIAGFTMRTTNWQTGASTLVPLPFSSTNASHSITHQPGFYREFMCQIATATTAVTPGAATSGTGGVLLRGVEPESPVSAPTEPEEKATTPK